MRRSYTQTRRAEQSAATRQRIVEAAVDLHGSLGPARTSFSLLAERAGVQRQTLYAHFPDEQSLFTACSGLALERDPLPDSAAWRALAGEARLRSALGELYAWYGRNAELLGCVLRDAEYHEPTRAIAAARFGPVMADYAKRLGDGLDPAQRAMLTLALSYHSWRSLVRDGGLGDDAAAAAMARAVLGAA